MKINCHASIDSRARALERLIAEGFKTKGGIVERTPVFDILECAGRTTPLRGFEALDMQLNLVVGRDHVRQNVAGRFLTVREVSQVTNDIALCDGLPNRHKPAAGVDGQVGIQGIKSVLMIDGYCISIA